MLVAVANTKGGQGKTTWSCALAGWLEAELLDLDPQQGDSISWGEMAGHPVRVVWPEESLDALEACSKDKIWHVADCPPHEGEAMRAALAYAQAVLVPVGPGPQDARGWGRMQELLQEAKEGPNPALRVGLVLNGLRPRIALHEAVAKMLRDAHKPSEGVWFLGVAGLRQAVAEAYATGAHPFLVSGHAGEEFQEILKMFTKIVLNTKSK